MRPLVTPRAPTPPPAIDLVARIPAAAIALFPAAMQAMLLTPSATDTDIGLTEHLDRTRLDFTLDSLHDIDRCLDAVHANTETIAGLPLLSTMWTVAMYVGEVIRREAPNKFYERVIIGEPASATGDTTVAYPDLGMVRALPARDRELCMPSRVVLRMILRGSNARSVYSFARAATAKVDSPLASGRPHMSTYRSRRSQEYGVAACSANLNRLCRRLIAIRGRRSGSVLTSAAPRRVVTADSYPASRTSFTV